MKISYSVTSLILGLAVAGIILLLVRRNHLHARFAIWWLAVAGASIMLGAFPQLINTVAKLLGVHYPPTLLMVVGLALVFIKMLTMDLNRSEQEQRLRRLTRRLALLEEQYQHTLSKEKDNT